MGSECPLWGLSAPFGVQVPLLGSECPFWGRGAPYGVVAPLLSAVPTPGGSGCHSIPLRGGGSLWGRVTPYGGRVGSLWGLSDAFGGRVTLYGVRVSLLGSECPF